MGQRRVLRGGLLQVNALFAFGELGVNLVHLEGIQLATFSRPASHEPSCRCCGPLDLPDPRQTLPSTRICRGTRASLWFSKEGSPPVSLESCQRASR